MGWRTHACFRAEAGGELALRNSSFGLPVTDALETNSSIEEEHPLRRAPVRSWFSVEHASPDISRLLSYITGFRINRLQ
jgi:hypothetical protein